MKEINKYAKKSVNKLDLSLKEKRELKIQFIDHMTELYNNHKLEGFSDEDSLIYAIEMFNDNTQTNKKNHIKFGLISVFTIYIIIFSLIFVSVSRSDVSNIRLNIYRLIPFQYFFYLLQAFRQDKLSTIEILKEQILLFLSFIPMGIFIPIITEKYKSFILNLKKFIYFTLGLEIMKIILGFGIAKIDYFLIHLLGCLIGYVLFKLIIFLSKKLSNKKILA
ncbi:VanZ family protein [Clostridium sp. Sa3CUN1]|uniref:VanZ family protein n=1 Tax=Clostridium gallinarum TaxID=2762246 RepID=A0ABR8Q7B7_9CLOT|nr:VanZ family protein [Clostridium gallinarum]MBD7916324.1 VanZ family protein [Clostridium gallinarum]